MEPARYFSVVCLRGHSFHLLELDPSKFDHIFCIPRLRATPSVAAELAAARAALQRRWILGIGSLLVKVGKVRVPAFLSV